MSIVQYSVWWVELAPVRGSEQDGIRPCLVVSPDETNSTLPVSTVVPLTTRRRNYKTRVKLSSMANHTGRVSYAIIDQIRTVSHGRFKNHICEIELKEIQAVKDVIRRMLVD